jgi:hypothetical protein
MSKAHAVVCIHPDRTFMRTAGVCWPCYSKFIWKGQSREKDGAWAAYRRGAPAPARHYEQRPQQGTPEYTAKVQRSLATRTVTKKYADKMAKRDRALLVGYKKVTR